jgi:hypothetical protein
VEGILWRAAETISAALLCTLARTSLADALSLAKTSLATSAALVWISSASYLAYSRRLAAR